MSYLRGGIRRALWNRSPVKLEFLKRHRERIPNPNPKGRVAEVWGARCALCNELHAEKNIEVDHRTGNHSLRCVDDLQAFVEGIVCVGFDDLQLVCKECHKIKSYAEKNDVSFEEARATKIAIDLGKQKKDKAWLEARGLIPATSGPKRRQQIIKAMQEEV